MNTRFLALPSGLTLLILALIPFERIPSWATEYPIHATVRISQILGVILICLTVSAVLSRREELRKPYWIILAVFNLICFLSFVYSPDKLRSGSVVVYTVFVSVLAFAISVNSRRIKEKYLITAILIGAGLVCAFGYFQFFGDLAGLSTSVTGLRPQYSQPVFGFPRIQSTGLEPLYFGNYLLIPAAILFFGYLIKGWRQWVLLPTLLLVTEIWLTLSRGAILALCLEAVLFMIVAYFFKRIRRGIVIILITALGSLCASGLVYYGTHHAVRKNFQSSHAVSNFSKQATNFSSGESAVGRGETRDLAIQAWKEHPWLGIGPGEFGYYAHAHNSARYQDNHTIVNNEPLELLAETGILGFTAFLIFVLALFSALFKSMKNQNELFSLRTALVIALLAIGFQYLSFSTLYITHVWILIGLLAGTCILPSKTPKASL